MYSNNQEYRQLLRRFFNMNIDKIALELKDEKYDDETFDEMLFDNDAVNKGLEDILKKTQGNPLFEELFCLAAARMFSVDRETGLCILLSYDFFNDFYHLWAFYNNHPNDILETNEYFITLKSRLS